MSYIIKNLHFIVIHIPIAMLLFSFIFDLLALIMKKKDWHSAGILTLIVGTLGAIASVITGPEDRNPLLETHEHYGQITMLFFIILTLIRVGFLWKKKLDIGNHPVYLIAAFIGVLLVSYTGHLGGQMVHKDRPVPQSGQIRNGGNLQQKPSATEGQRPNQVNKESGSETRQTQ